MSLVSEIEIDEEIEEMRGGGGGGGGGGWAG
jgi:hypothetical protein